MARAINSLPVPVSPWIRTVESVGATLETCANTLRSDSEEPTISSNMEERTIYSRSAHFRFACGLRLVYDRRCPSLLHTNECLFRSRPVTGCTGSGTTDTY